MRRSSYDRIIDHAVQGGSEEVCGILGGEFGQERSVVTSVHEATNVADAPDVRYYIDPEEQLAVTEQLEADGADIVGFYHSHPAGPTSPSETDADRATWPDRSYVIVALDGQPFVGSWRWRDTGGFEPEVVALD